MKIALLGGTGYVGSRLLAEALRRGHHVSVLVRDTEKIPPRAQVSPMQTDILDTTALAARLAGHAAVLSAYNPGLEQGLDGARSIILAVKLSAVPRLLCVGGAGSLLLPDGSRVLDSPEFPSQAKQSALNTAEFLGLLKQEPTLDWTMLSPAEHLVSGTRTGIFRLGGDHVLRDEQGQSRVSVEDYAVALLDELDACQHSRQRFSVAY